ncbi:hypothetical protein ACFXN2_14925 [Streptomyces kronopolitis]|uniref:hypothetical protein n=1 Tax=Streptomyces kronopolitis TaxID=1612435 RepID=UPI00367F18D5
MDEGTAALIAGVAGMIGALGGAIAGAIGAVRGARVGAERTAEATRQQVRDQATAEHGHWLRQQRQAAYSSFIAANQATERAAQAALVGEPGRRTQWDADFEAFKQSIEELNDVASQISVLGPDSMIRASGRIFRDAACLTMQLADVRHTHDFTQDHQDRIDEAWDEYAEAGNLFQEAARDVLIGTERPYVRH